MRLVIEGVEDGVLRDLGNLRANLIWLRKQHGLTNNEIGILAGVKERQVSIWLNAPITTEPNGQETFNPRMVNIAKLGAALGVPVGDFFLETTAFARRHKKLRPLVLLAAKPSSSNPPSSSVSTAASTKDSKRPQLSVIQGEGEQKPLTMGSLALDVADDADGAKYLPVMSIITHPADTRRAA